MAVILSGPLPSEARATFRNPAQVLHVQIRLVPPEEPNCKWKDHNFHETPGDLGQNETPLCWKQVVLECGSQLGGRGGRCVRPSSSAKLQKLNAAESNGWLCPFQSAEHGAVVHVLHKCFFTCVNYSQVS